LQSKERKLLMENFIVSARKYRPVTFRTVVGQSSLTITLKNAISSKHLAHAYLFCGPRGVGKTTCARIFAKTINCQNLTSEGEACNACESCVSFNEQRSYNIHELDAASNNGVDDIRTLIDQVRVPPQIGKYSVYIIDEVHMLSQGAFNAFLKTLEEPPAHAIFILATTEKHKIIPTILSRCQIYDFNRISVSDTVAHLKYVAESENVSIDENALNVIAQKSDGGMRDALSIFDQLVSFCGNNIDYQGVITNLNVLDYDYYFRLTDHFLSGNISEALLIFNEILNKGFDAHHFITGLSSHFRDLLVCKDPATVALMEVGADIGNKYKMQAQQCPADFLIQALKINNECDLNYRISNNKRLLAELTLIRLSQLTDEKKKGISPEDKLPLLKKINTDDSVQLATPVQTASPVVTQAVKTTTEPVKQQPSIPQNEAPKVIRPVSISITKGVNKIQTSPEEKKVVESPSKIGDDDYSEEEFLKSWRNYATLIPEVVSLVSYIANTTPESKGNHEFEVAFTNTFQEKEFHKHQQDIQQHIRKALNNASIKFKTLVIDVSEQFKSTNPEDILKKMAEENPAINILKTNLNLEID